MKHRLQKIQENFIGKEINGNVIMSININDDLNILEMAIININSKKIYYRTIWYSLNCEKSYIIIRAHSFNENEIAFTIENEKCIKYIKDNIKERKIYYIYDVYNGEMIYDYRTITYFSW